MKKFEKICKTDINLARLRKNIEKIQVTEIKNERMDITADFIEVKRDYKRMIWITI